MDYTFAFWMIVGQIFVWWMVIPIVQKRVPEHNDFWKGISIGVMSVIFFELLICCFLR